ncbi:MAG: biotin/lipoyl-containing protein [Myxococcota bacterium]|nr:biotin/lipoyl-containing protein [Myxococcota bacterium]
MGTRYLTWIDGQEALVELDTSDDGQVTARISGEDQETRDITLERRVGSGGAHHILLPDGRGFGGRVISRDKGQQTVVLGSHRVEVRAMAERDAWLGDGDLGGDEGAITVAMPGLVVKLLVDEGQEVSQGDPVLIVEAMKMENEVKAGRDGVVGTIHVAVGDSVEADAILAEIVDP